MKIDEQFKAEACARHQAETRGLSTDEKWELLAKRSQAMWEEDLDRVEDKLKDRGLIPDNGDRSHQPWQGEPRTDRDMALDYMCQELLAAELLSPLGPWEVGRKHKWWKTFNRMGRQSLEKRLHTLRLNIETLRSREGGGSDAP
jgi:hypothetical protein